MSGQKRKTWSVRQKIVMVLPAMLLLSVIVGKVEAQQVAVKTNLLSDAFLNVNAGIEVSLAPKWTLDTKGEFNGWTLSHSRRWKHWSVQPEARYWFCNRMDGHFIGIHLHSGQYNIGNINNGIRFLGTDYSKLSDYRYQGWFFGGGIAYGFSWVLSQHWNLEAEIGVGYSYTQYDQFRCVNCGKKVQENVPHHYVGPTKLAINLVYVF